MSAEDKNAVDNFSDGWGCRNGCHEDDLEEHDCPGFSRLQGNERLTGERERHLGKDNLVRRVALVALFLTESN
jgi:hypothetical protein